MKKFQSTIVVLLIIGLTLTFVNCKKDDTQHPPSFFNYSTFTDSRDGNTYKYIKIGTQEWMTENLSYRTTNGSWFSYDSETYGIKYGRLYTWEAAKQAVPTGWHLPTDTEWKQLEIALGMSRSDADGINHRGTNEGSKLKETYGWGNVQNTDNVGFKALPGGFRSNSGEFFELGWSGYWWSSTEDDNSKAWFRYMTFDISTIYRNLSFKGDAYSVRCVKD